MSQSVSIFYESSPQIFSGYISIDKAHYNKV